MESSTQTTSSQVSSCKATSSQSSSSQSSSSKASSSEVTYRKGKWSFEEEAYSSKLKDIYECGILLQNPNMSLRQFLAHELNCEPMRITKKFKNQIGKTQYIPAPSGYPDDFLNKEREELESLKLQFEESLVQKKSVQQVQQINVTPPVQPVQPVQPIHVAQQVQPIQPMQQVQYMQYMHQMQQQINQVHQQVQQVQYVQQEQQTQLQSIDQIMSKKEYIEYSVYNGACVLIHLQKAQCKKKKQSKKKTHKKNLIKKVKIKPKQQYKQKKQRESLIGKRIRKFFPGKGTFKGIVEKKTYSKSHAINDNWYWIKYDDDDTEELTEKEVKKRLIN